MAVEAGFAVGDGVFDTPLPAVPLTDPRESVGQECEAGLVAWQARLTHDEWRRACWMLETARARADTLQRWPDPDARVIAAALGWSVTMAAARLETAAGALERLPRLGAAMCEGWLEHAKAAVFVSGLRDVTDEQAAVVVDRLIGAAPKLGMFELGQRVAAAVADVDPLGAENRRNAAVARSRVSTRIAPSGAAEIHGLDLDPGMAIPAFERILAVAEVALEQLKAAGSSVGPAKVQAQVYLRLLHGCPDGSDDLAVAAQVVLDLTPTPPAQDPIDLDDLPDGPDDLPDDGPDDRGPDSNGHDGAGPDGDGPDGDGPDGDGPDDGGSGGGADDGDSEDLNDNSEPHGEPVGSNEDRADDRRDGSNDSGSNDSGSNDGISGAADSRGEQPAPSGPDESVDDAAHGSKGSGDDGRAVDRGSADAPDDAWPGWTATPSPQPSPAGWQPGDPEPDPPPPDTPDPRIPTTDPPPPLAARLTERGLVFSPATLRTTWATVLGLERAHGRLRAGTLTGWDAYRAAWTRTCAQWRVLLYNDIGALQWVLLVRPPLQPDADPRYRRQVVELTAHTREVDALDLDAPDDDGSLVGIWAELARRTKQALAAARARPPEEHPAVTTRDAGNRFPGAELTRWIHARDYTSRFPMSTVPAVACPIDHTHDHTLGGPTQADNLGPLSVGDHLRKHDPLSGWTVRQTRPGRFVWTAPTGTHHTVEPDSYRPLRPVARAPFDHGITDTRTEPRPQTPWRPRTDRHGHITDAQRHTLDELDRRRRHKERRPPNPFDDDPPF
ncbi:hypothetical protein GCM10023201_34530 [Actinomycetospora corticicola]|uniref:DUF222 domain-containing protein n=1 Tax=Actinomycetospora corticicola TaxID=663602 RepID=A0A7Y9J7W7_9PSEU|nr:DUF222 domain-containing protein [Actinomycetospora corticicola]NYD38845.1 hypothetical protein [Actinomycetospora corticicola]